MLAMSLVSNKPFSKRVPPSKLELNDEVSEVFSYTAGSFRHGLAAEWWRSAPCTPGLKVTHVPRFGSFGLLGSRSISEG